MWNLSMRTPLPQKSPVQFNATGNSFAFNNSASKSTVNGNANKKRKSDYCWNFNKRLKCKFGNKCRFIERCSYCDNGSDGVYNCPKLEGKDQKEKKVISK